MRIGILLPALFALLPGVAEARTAWTSGTYVYADLCTQRGTGEIAGRRITLRRSPNGDGIVYEVAPSGLSAPAEVVGVSFDDSARAVSFSARTEGGTVAFRGVATQDALTGTLSDPEGEHSVSLRRVLRSHAREACPSESTGSLRASR